MKVTVTVDIPDGEELAFRGWVAAGGIVNNYSTHALASGVRAPKAGDLPLLVSEAHSKIDQINGVLRKLVPLA